MFFTSKYAGEKTISNILWRLTPLPSVKAKLFEIEHKFVIIIILDFPSFSYSQAINIKSVSTVK
jgi:hypothetical protein